MKTQSCDFLSDRCQNCNYFAVGLFLGDRNDTKKKKKLALKVIMSHYLFFRNDKCFRVCQLASKPIK